MLKSLFDPFTYRLAWRDTRSYRRRLMLFFSCIALGVAALVSIRSIGQNLEQAVHLQAKTLLGADLSFTSRSPFNDTTEELIASIDGDVVREVRFGSMVYFPRVDGTRLIEVRAMNGVYPFYGEFTTEPAGARSLLATSDQVLVDEALMLQYGVEIGDSLRLGQSTFVIGGRVRAIAGESAAVMDVAPRVYIPEATLDQTGLTGKGSLVSYRAHFKLADETIIAELTETLREHREEHGLRFETVQRRVRNVGRVIDRLYRFLSLAGFAALLLGCVGVASAVHVYIRQKLSTIAVLRCLGARPDQALAVYIIQTLIMGFLGSTAGALLGIAVQQTLPLVLADILPVTIGVETDWNSVIQGVIVGCTLSLLFALLPLVKIRHVSPLLSLRASYETTGRRVDPAQVVVAAAITILIFGLSIVQMGRIQQGIGVAAGIAGAFALLALAAFGLTYVVRKYFPRAVGFEWKQGVSNLYRPNNQTQILVLALGLGTFLIGTLYVVQHVLLNQVNVAGGDNRPNIVLFDVQIDQTEDVRQAIENQGLPVIHDVRVVTMRLASVNGETVQDIMKREGGGNFVYTREYRSTYRDRLFDSEKIVSGKWIGTTDEQGTVPISVADDLAERLGVQVGDRLTFNVQGVPIACEISSLRDVDFQRIQPNFWVLFPAGILEDAPQFAVFTTRVNSAEQSASLQRNIVKQHPNVSVIDIGLVLRTVDNVLDKVSFVIRFMALFSVLTGLVVLTAAVISSRYQRIRESVLLRTMGASRRQVRRILVLEYLFLGTLAALSGLTLSLCGGWLLSFMVFETDFSIPGPAIAIVFALIVLLTVTVGMMNSRGISNRPPLEVLRSEY
jgi:putative ABC transport system permease protein